MREVLISPDKQIDQLQVEMSKLQQVECPLKHIFTPGMYTRQIFMPKDTVIVSKIHKTTHTFNVSMGSAAVYNAADSFLGLIEAPYLGITIANTRRILQIIADCIWTTFHPLTYITGEENNWPEEEKNKLLMRIEEDLIERRDIL